MKETAVRTYYPDIIRILRQKAGMTRQELADAVGATQNSVWHWETGRHCPTMETFLKVLEATEFEILIRKKVKVWER